MILRIFFFFKDQNLDVYSEDDFFIVEKTVETTVLN